MANIKSAKKRILVNQTKALQNQMVKSQLKTVIKKFNAAVVYGNNLCMGGGTAIGFPQIVAFAYYFIVLYHNSAYRYFPKAFSYMGKF